MDFSHVVYINSDKYLDGRSIVMFDLDSAPQLKKEAYPFVIQRIITVFMEALGISRKYCGIDEICVIVKLKHLKKSKIGIKFSIYMAKLLKNMFPDKLYKCFLKNPPFIFHTIFMAITPFIDKITRKKISLIKNGRFIEYDEY